MGPVLSGTLAGKKLGRGMSFWMVGGEMGRAAGPLIVVTAIAYLTLEGIPWLMFAGVFTSIFLYGKLRTITTLPRNNGNHIPWKTGLKMMRKVMAPIGFLIFARSMMVATLSTFMPTYFNDRRGQSMGGRSFIVHSGSSRCGRGFFVRITQ